MRLEEHLVLNRFLHSLFGAQDLENLKGALYGMQEGPSADGQSYFYGHLVGRAGLDPWVASRLASYDRRVMAYEARLGQRRDSFRLRYFQYLALLYTEAYLDMLTSAPAVLLARVNGFLKGLQELAPHLTPLSPFVPEDLRRLAFYMATGSGKTLLMHAHLWQILHYLEHGRHPEALVQRTDGRHAFRNILLITPGGGLSEQHLEELALSGIAACHISQRRETQALWEPLVLVVEIQKLNEEASGEGASIAIESLLDDNLVFVDEGHKGTGSEAQTWKDRQKRLSANGLLVEYSATFAQAIGAAKKKDAEALLAEYGKAILVDYSYRHFHNDGYGKAFQVLNLAQGSDKEAHELLVGGLLTFYQQVLLHETHREAYRPYNLETPLWVFVGYSVSAVFRRNKREQSDVATVVAFLRRFLEDEAWATGAMARLLAGESGFRDAATGRDLFTDAFPFLESISPDDLYKAIVGKLFHGRGALQVCELKTADGEFGLRVSTPEGGAEQPYFGVINIGDTSEFKRHLRERLGLETSEDQFTPSLFGDLQRADSNVYLLVGAQKFSEGWSSWRVSTMGLLNTGKGEGPKVFQLFGRGVRLKGMGLSLKRSEAVHGTLHPDGLVHLETLQIVGWNADYVEQFRRMMEQEGFFAERTLPVVRMQPWPSLPIPKVRQGYSAAGETWRLGSEPLRVTLDLRPMVSAYDGAVKREGELSGAAVAWNDCRQLLDMQSLYLDLLEHKQAQGYGNLYLDRTALPGILVKCEVRLPTGDLNRPDRLQEAAGAALRTYMDRFYASKERQAQSQRLEPQLLREDDETVLSRYTLRISDAEALKRIDTLLASTDALREGGSPLPRLHIDFHLYNPLLEQASEGADAGVVSISPPGLNRTESQFVKDLRVFWGSNHESPRFRNLEVHLLRNLPRVGVGYFTKSGFYPDFVLWARDKETGQVRVVFVEPHGMHHGGLPGNKDKIEALHALHRLGETASFRKRGITVDGYILTETPKGDIPGAETLSWQELAEGYRVVRLGSACYPRLLLGPAAQVGD
jgi:hypothetical protein